jgi:hypothetical protein
MEFDPNPDAQQREHGLNDCAEKLRVVPEPPRQSLVPGRIGQGHFSGTAKFGRDPPCLVQSQLWCTTVTRQVAFISKLRDLRI